MRACLFKTIICVAILEHYFIVDVDAAQQNKTYHHVQKQKNTNILLKSQNLPAYRSFQPIQIKYHKSIYPKVEDRVDYDITSYDTEYGGVVSNFTSSIYDDNPPLYPNPEFMPKSRIVNRISDGKGEVSENDIELPDDSLADADLKEHNLIDSVTYLYGFNNCHGARNEYMVLIYITCGLTILLLISAVIWLMWSKYTADFRLNSKLYPIIINLLCSLTVCNIIFIVAVVGVSSPTQCERVALVLHYTHISCAIWIVTLGSAVAEYCTCETMLPLKYNYLLAYGVPAVVVMFNYALSMEHYEIKHYCWMSIEKGMVMGFMVPTMILILINTAIIIIGLQSVTKKQTEMLTVKIQELVDHHIANWPKSEQSIQNGSVETLNMFTPGSSRKNTDSSEILEKEYNFSEDDCQYGNTGISSNDNGDSGIGGNGSNEKLKNVHDKSLLNLLYMDNLSWKWTWNTEGTELKNYLNLCLVMEPFFAINWVMGVVAIENASHWTTPTIYLILMSVMYIYLTATICTTLPIVKSKNTEQCCEDVVVEPTSTLTRARTTDSIPLLDPAIQQSTASRTPADTISTISI